MTGVSIAISNYRRPRILDSRLRCLEQKTQTRPGASSNVRPEIRNGEIFVPAGTSIFAQSRPQFEDFQVDMQYCINAYQDITYEILLKIVCLRT